MYIASFNLATLSYCNEEDLSAVFLASFRLFAGGYFGEVELREMGVSVIVNVNVIFPC